MKATAVKKQPVRRAATQTSRQRKLTKREIVRAWARASGVVNTGETDLSTREGLGD